MSCGATTTRAVATVLFVISFCSASASDTGSSRPVGTSFLQVHSKTTSTDQLKASDQSRSSSNSSAGIINGSLVTDASGKYSFFAMPTQSNAQDDDTWLGCGASIISPTWGMTAQHCFGGGNEPCTGPKQLALWIGDLHLSEDSVISGQVGGSKKSVRVEAEVVCHPTFDGKCSHGHDMVLLKLKTALPDWVKPVRLGLDGAGSAEVGQVTNNIGFGLRESPDDPQTISGTTPSEMREAKLTIFDDDYRACKLVYDGGYGCSDDASESPAKNKDQQLCAGATDEPERDTCSGDSGSPMLDKDGVQIGIVSYGGGPGKKMRGDGRICADPKYMGVYTRVSAFSSFIKNHVTDLPVYSMPASMYQSQTAGDNISISVTVGA